MAHSEKYEINQRLNKYMEFRQYLTESINRFKMITDVDESKRKKLAQEWRTTYPTKKGEKKDYNPFVATHPDFIIISRDKNGKLIAGNCSYIEKNDIVYSHITVSKSKGTATKMIQWRNKKLKQMGYKYIRSEAGTISGYNFMTKMGGKETGETSHIGKEQLLKL